jgi:hypothetical protein
MEEIKTFLTIGGNVKWYSFYGKLYVVSKNITLYSQQFSLLVCALKNRTPVLLRHICMPIFLVASLTISQISEGTQYVKEY